MGEKEENRQEGRSVIFRMALVMMAGYLALAAAFYFLAGEQLHIRRSRGELALPASDSGTVELTAGNVVEQTFSAKIQRLERVSVQWGAYYRQNAGTVVVELWDMRDGTLLMSRSFDAAAIPEGGMTELAAGQPIEGLYGAPLLLRLYSPDGTAGSSVSPLKSSTTELEDAALTVNGVPAEGTLCFSASGTDYIWTGLHYWQFVAAGAACLALFWAVVWLRRRQGKHSYVLNAVEAVKRYRFLIRQLVSRDFKTKYKRSVLGVLWSFLNPLLTMCVQYFVFSTIFKSDVPNYTVYLLSGIVFFNFFSEATSMALTSVVGNAGLITKVYMPKYIYPLTRVMSSLINLLISLIPLVLVCGFSGVRFTKATVLVLLFLVCLVIFCIGLGMLLSTMMVFFRDTQFLWGVLSMMWMYATPIFYPESILPESYRWVLRVNPLYHFLTNARLCILNGISPEPIAYVQCFLIALGTLLAGAFVFYKKQDKFLLYL